MAEPIIATPLIESLISLVDKTLSRSAETASTSTPASIPPLTVAEVLERSGLRRSGSPNA